MNERVNIFWFRRDLRLEDNAGLYNALKNNLPVLPVFIFDRDILDKLEETSDRRVEFIFATLEKMQEKMEKLGSSLEVIYDFPVSAFEHLLKKYNVEKVYLNHDYEPQAIERDNVIRNLLNKNGVSMHSYKDQVIFEKNEIIKDNGDPYTIYTPYSRKWKSALTPFFLQSYPATKYYANFFKQSLLKFPSLQKMGFKATEKPFPSSHLKEELVRIYDKQRDFPGINGTSRMGVHLRFGTISIRQLAEKAVSLNQTYLNELIWRDFYQMILFHFPKLGRGKSFKEEYEWIEWINDEGQFQRWCDGLTGYPIVDAGMRELNSTGFMHNRVRMIVASFLAKHLLIDWRWGEAYFSKKLLDYDLASNNGGWQWSAGSGCDAAPYFRVFNPTLQTKKFDPELKYIRKWVPELDEITYPLPIVEHEMARKRALQVYGNALKRRSADK